MTKAVASTEYALQDLIRFAELSGDWNPIHTDPVAARRLLSKSVLVHGILALLWALDKYAQDRAAPPARVTAFFQQFINPGERLDLYEEHLPQDGVRLSLRRAESELMSVLLRGDAEANSDVLPNGAIPKENAEVHSFAELKEARGQIPLVGDAISLRAAFPHVVRLLGVLPTAAIMAYSRLVGMKCPGLHSMFVGADFSLAPNRQDARLDWQVAKHSLPLAPLKIEALGGGLNASLQALVRPAPVSQPGMRELQGLLPMRLCANQRVAVIGGSRGLGELAAKLSGGGGADVLLTYNSGSDDASRVCAEIKGHGGSARALRVDVAAPGRVIDEMRSFAPTHLYYFATPSISSRKNTAFDDALFRQFRNIYADRFVELIDHLSSTLSHVYYPSTTFVETHPPAFREYASAKMEGEKAVENLQSRYPRIKFVIERLPPLQTDQTASVLPTKAQSAVQMMRNAVERMSGSIGTSSS